MQQFAEEKPGLPSTGNAGDAAQDDPYRWLEDIDSEQALAWVAARNAESEGELKARPGFDALRARLAAILDSREKIPYASVHGGLCYNFWRDAEHVRGIWRRTTLAQYRRPEPAWETLLDLDELARGEGENWVWAGVTWLEPHGDRVLVALSRGGGDAHELREFDLAARSFVEGGFFLPEAKSDVAWIDRDTLFVGTDFGPGSLSESGYPRIVKEWKRGTPLGSAVTVYEARPGDLAASGYTDSTPGYEREFIQRQLDFTTSELFLRRGGRLLLVPKPLDANAFTVRDQLVIELRSDWQPGARLYPQGALLATGFDEFMAGGLDFQLLFTPTPETSLDGVAVTRSALLLTILDKVKNRVVELRHVDGAWRRREVAAPAMGALGVASLDPDGSDEFFLTVTDFLHPTTLYLMRVGMDELEPLKAMPAFFDAHPYTVGQHAARSKDGTMVPYFVVMNRDTLPSGRNPTLLYGYGGFEVSLKPFYSGMTGAAWLDAGGIYVLANIRGGGEFGPRWHQAALRQHRQRAFDDFLAVAEDLIARGLTSPPHLGIMGGSNGGLLVGAAFTQRPELFGAVVCQVPLLDMRRYHALLAGHSWMSEYGDPDDPAEWSWLARYSPYHQVSAGQRYPRVLFTSSTRDDRVHPAHARKMAARMLEQGHDVLYWENTEGGHAGAADNAQTARMLALTYTFLLDALSKRP
ncbi:prolyl oligopeptidase family protein [Massilia sp. ST3]|uniref:prolyl oligopeptidase family serine peptidase n=1 Tax=Massilia sp. ST3 TaxID=2824903 RepID=UPI001B825BC0|nr:prolyl oligopeptidase family serine peptidase [Massilia sp. ST3]MBQ5949943.1 S9 family peptidase [Massilia sp. ST3]